MPRAAKQEDNYLETAKKLVSALERDNQDEADAHLNDLNTSSHSVLFQEIGKLTRDLHNTLRSFENELSFIKLAEKDMPEATTRLNYVIEKTDEAASNTLTIVERYIPVCEELEQESRSLAGEWTRFMDRKMDADDFRALVRRLNEYLNKNQTSYSDIKSGMSEIMIAQDYQDITGQIIKKVISLVQNVENNLIRVIKISGESNTGSKPVTKKKKRNTKQNTSKSAEPDGPQVPEIRSSDAVSNQDEVDDLLSSLGF